MFERRKIYVFVFLVRQRNKSSAADTASQALLTKWEQASKHGETTSLETTQLSTNGPISQYLSSLACSAILDRPGRHGSMIWAPLVALSVLAVVALTLLPSSGSSSSWSSFAQQNTKKLFLHREPRRISLGAAGIVPMIRPILELTLIISWLTSFLFFMVNLGPFPDPFRTNSIWRWRVMEDRLVSSFLPWF